MPDVPDLSQVAPKPRDRGGRVVVLPTTARDAEAIVKVLASPRVQCVVVRTVGALCAEIGAGADVAIVSEEAINDGVDPLAACLAGQPVWSDLPVLVLSKAGVESRRLAGHVARLGNVSVVERPVRISTLQSLVWSSLRARDRQREVRDHLEERDRLLASERAARAQVEEASRIKDEFLATLSHELRTPLNAIVGWSGIIRAAPGDAEEVAEGIEIIERNARAQSQIIEDLLDMSRIINGKIRLDVRQVDLAGVIRAAVDTVMPAADAKGVRVELAVAPGVGVVSGDPNRLQQVLWNLISNGIKFTPRGGLVRLSLQRTETHVRVIVTDTGDGIEGDFLPHVFDRFRQADASTTRRYGGLGLGLAIVKQLVELHGGTIHATSPGRGRGSSFVVALPLAPARVDPEPASERRQAAPTVAVKAEARAAIAGRRVLVVDDEPDARRMVRRILEDCGAQVSTAASAAEAFALLQSTRPDALVSDIGMPNEDGYGLIGRIRALPAESGGRTPAIAVTAYARSEDRTKVLTAGFQHHLAKPVEPAEIIALVADLVRPDHEDN